MENYFAFPYCISSLWLELGIRWGTNKSGRGRGKYTRWARNRECGEGKGGGGERKQEGVPGRRRELRLTEQPRCRAQQPRYLSASAQLEARAVTFPLCRGEADSGEATCPGQRRKAGFGNSERPAEEAPLPLHAAGNPHPPGRGARKPPSGRHNHPPPVPSASPPVRTALGSPEPLHPAFPPAAWAGSNRSPRPGGSPAP